MGTDSSDMSIGVPMRRDDLIPHQESDSGGSERGQEPEAKSLKSVDLRPTPAQETCTSGYLKNGGVAVLAVHISESAHYLALGNRSSYRLQDMRH